MSADDELPALGPFFAVERATGPALWRPLRDLLDPAALDERVTSVRTALARLAGGAVEQRVAASTLSLGLFARLISPVLGAGALGAELPRPSLDGTWWQPVDAGPWPLALAGPSVAPDPAAVLTDVVRPLADALAAQHSLSMRILWGNAASVVFGAVAMIRSTRPDLFPRARGIAHTLLSGPLAGTGELRGRRFARATCCLYYRIPGGGYCGDCVLAHR